jgi:DNA-binding MarR family transcriptional regulator
MTEKIRRLERAGLVERWPAPSDARASLIVLTAPSRRLHRWRQPSSPSLINWHDDGSGRARSRSSMPRSPR